MRPESPPSSLFWVMDISYDLKRGQIRVLSWVLCSVIGINSTHHILRTEIQHTVHSFEALRCIPFYFLQCLSNLQTLIANILLGLQRLFLTIGQYKKAKYLYAFKM